MQANDHTTGDFTMDDVRATMEEADELGPNHVPDVYVMTYVAEETLRSHFGENPQPGFGRRSMEAGRILGIPFESCPTLSEAYKRVIELRKEGKRVALVSE